MTDTALDPWEIAYLRFETPDQEQRKFRRRLEKLGAKDWPSDSAVLEICCGRGGGLLALQSLGLTDIEGIDIDSKLLKRYRGPAMCQVADCRALPIADGAKDVVIVQGGLHHLVDLPDDLRLTLLEIRRVLRDGGRFVSVEPWLTPFLHVVHAATEHKSMRRAWKKLDALANMIEHERLTYLNWLGQPNLIREVVTESFETERDSVRMGKWSYVGRKR